MMPPSNRVPGLFGRTIEVGPQFPGMLILMLTLLIITTTGLAIFLITLLS